MSQPQKKNILENTGTLTVHGDLVIGDQIIYRRQELSHSVLFLNIAPTEEESVFSFTLEVKARHSGETREKIVPLFGTHLPLGEDFWRSQHRIEQARRGIILQNSVVRYWGSVTPTELLEIEAACETTLVETLEAAGILAEIRKFTSLLKRGKLSELLLVIHSPNSAVMDLPWEIIQPALFPQPDASPWLGPEGFLLLRSFEKQLSDYDLSAPESRAAPMRLLFVASMPDNLSPDQQLLAIEQEQRNLIEAVGELGAGNQPLIIIDWLEDASLAAIETSLRERRHDIVHISGHGGHIPGEAGGGVLILEDENGEEQRVSGAELGRVINRYDSVKLVMLSACETARCKDQGFVGELAKYAPRPTVIGMRFSVTDPGATAFTQVLYDQLAKEQNFTRALAAGRRALWEMAEKIRQDQPHLAFPAEWFTPVVFNGTYLDRLVDPHLGYHIPEQLKRRSDFLKTTTTKLIGAGFIGRKGIRRQLRKLLQAGQPVVIFGLGGMGKTTLAEALAHNFDHGSHRVIIFRGQEIEEPRINQYLLDLWAGSSSDNPEQGTNIKKLNALSAEPEQKLGYIFQNFLARQKTIIIFDNIENQQRQADGSIGQHIQREELARFLQFFCERKPKNCQVMFTTRYRIPELESTVEHLPLEQMTFAESYRLFDADDQLRQISKADRYRIYQHLQGHPRAYEYLANLLVCGSAPQLSDLLEKLGEVDQQLRANLLLEQLFEHLPAGLQQTLISASAFYETAVIDRLSRLIGRDQAALLEDLQALADWGLCLLKDDGFSIHRITADFGLDQLIEAEKQDHWRRIAEDYHSGEEIDIEDGILAFYYFQRAEAWDRFATLGFSLEDKLRIWGYYKRAKSINQSIVEANIDQKTTAGALHNIGIIYQLQGDYSIALDYYQRSLKIFEQIDNTAGVANSFGQIGSIYQDQGDHSTALEYFPRSLKMIFEQIGNTARVANSLHHIGIIYQLQGDYSTALDYFQRSLKIFDQIDNTAGVANSLHHIGIIYQDRGDYSTALDYYQGSLKIQEQIGNTAGVANSLHHIGIIYQLQGDYSTALDYYQRSLKIFEQIDNTAGVANSLHHIGIIYQLQGDYSTALDYFQRSLKIQEQIGNTAGVANSLHHIGIIYQLQGDYSTALDYYQRSLKIQEQIGNTAGVASSLHQIGILMTEQGNDEGAVPNLLMAYQIFEKIGSPHRDITANQLRGIIERIGEERFSKIVEELGKIEE